MSNEITSPELLPELKLLLARMEKIHGSDRDCSQMAPVEGRAIAAAQNLKWNSKIPPQVRAIQTSIPGDSHPEGIPVSATLFFPKEVQPGIILFAHGGGFAFGSAACQSRFTSLLAAQTDRAVVSLDYRLAPEAPYPSGLHDIVSALQYLSTHMAELGVLPGKIVIAGESAGANLALSALIHQLQAETPTEVAGALLICGTFQGSNQTPSARTFRHGPGLTIARMERYLEWYNPEGISIEPTLFPLQMTDTQLSLLPPLALFAAEIDPLLSDSQALYNRCLAVRHTAALEVVKGVLHGFIQMSNDLPAAHNAIQHMSTSTKAFFELAR